MNTPLAAEALKIPPNPKGDKAKGKAASSVICFRCTEVGHHQLGCTNDPICYKCKLPGHMAAECAGRHEKKLKLFGFGIPRYGFYSMEIPDVEAVDKISGALISHRRTSY